MKLYAIKNDDGLYLKFDEYGDSDWYLLPDTWSDKSKADSYANDFHGHVVELLEAPAKVVVSEEEADNLECAKVYGNPANAILALAANHHPDDAEHILRAYVNGWTVEKPKRWNVKVPHSDDSYYYKIEPDACNAGDSFAIDLGKDNARFTAAEIEHYELTDCEKVVCADSARTTGEVTDDE